jgi:two-component system, OmpR family, alkaline phosphatase synthesis response regulator PhoP
MKTVKTILVADDETHILNVVSLKLKNAGFTVLCACDGQEALLLAKQHVPDLLITDYHMPHLNGMQLCDALRADDTLRHIPAMMLSARGYNLEEADTLRSGIVKMLSKPFSPRELLAAVDQVLATNAPVQSRAA